MAPKKMKQTQLASSDPKRRKSGKTGDQRTEPGPVKQESASDADVPPSSKAVKHEKPEPEEQRRSHWTAKS